MSAKPLLILGATPYALVFGDSFSAVKGYEIVGFVENLDRQRCAQPHGGLPVHWIDEVARMRGTHSAVCCLSTTLRDKYVEQVRQLGLSFATLVHPTAVVSQKTTVGEGASIDIGSLVAGFTEIGRHVKINRGVTVGHHTIIRDFVTIQPGVNMAGNCDIGRQTYIGIGATIVDGVKIGAHCVIGAGAVVTGDLPDRVLAVGVPAKIVKEGIDGK